MSACVRPLLEKNRDLIKIADNNGWSAFHFAAHNDLDQWIQYLLNIDKSVAYLTDKTYKRTPLHIAAYKGRITVLREFLKCLPDAWESVDANGQNIMHIAVSQDQKSVISLIFSELASFNVNNSTAIMNTLLNQRDKEGNTPLHLIAKSKCYIPELLDRHQWIKNWDANAVNNRYLTPRDVFSETHADTLTDEVLLRTSLKYCSFLQVLNFLSSLNTETM